MESNREIGWLVSISIRETIMKQRDLKRVYAHIDGN